MRVSYDFNGDGTFDRVETYAVFASNDLPGWESYVQNGSNLRHAEGEFANFTGGTVQLEVWNAFGSGDVALLTDAGDGPQSLLRIPFANLMSTTTPAPPQPDPDPLPDPQPATPSIGDPFYLLGDGANGLLGSEPSGVASAVIPASTTYSVDEPNAALTYTATGLTGTYDPARVTEFALYLDAGTQVANGTQARISYDFDGDGTFERVETFWVFASNDLPGWEVYTQEYGHGASLREAKGEFSDFTGGTLQLEVWNTFGGADVALLTDAAQPSWVRIPFVAQS